MDVRRELRRKIEKKQTEIQQWQSQRLELDTRVREGIAYVTGLEETLKLLPAEKPSDAATALRPDSMVANAREVILKAGKPLHVSEILRTLGKAVDHDTKASLSGSIGAYVRNNQIFTRPAPNVFGLVEFQQAAGADEDELPLDFGMVNGKAKQTEH